MAPEWDGDYNNQPRHHQSRLNINSAAGGGGSIDRGSSNCCQVQVEVAEHCIGGCCTFPPTTASATVATGGYTSPSAMSSYCNQPKMNSRRCSYCDLQQHQSRPRQNSVVVFATSHFTTTAARRAKSAMDLQTLVLREETEENIHAAAAAASNIQSPLIGAITCV